MTKTENWQNFVVREIMHSTSPNHNHFGNHLKFIKNLPTCWPVWLTYRCRKWTHNLKPIPVIKHFVERNSGNFIDFDDFIGKFNALIDSITKNLELSFSSNINVSDWHKKYIFIIFFFLRTFDFNSDYKIYNNVRSSPEKLNNLLHYSLVQIRPELHPLGGFKENQN